MKTSLLTGLIAIASIPALFAQDSTGKEIALGRKLAADIEREFNTVDDPVVQSYAGRIAASLASDSGTPFPVTVKVVESRQALAYAVPGGFLFVSSALILREDSEAELAGVMAHEVAHIAARHTFRNSPVQQRSEPANNRTIVFGIEYGICTRLARGIAFPASFQKDVQRFEQEADQLGVQYLVEAGYDPSGLADGFARLKAPATTGPQESFLEGKFEAVVTTSDFNEVKQRLASRYKKPKPPSLRNSEPRLDRREDRP